MKKNSKIEYNKIIILSIIVMLIACITMGTVAFIQYEKYLINFNSKINLVIENIILKYPDIDKNTLVEILDNNNINNKNCLRDYGIDISKDDLIQANKKNMEISVAVNIFLILVFSGILIYINLSYNYNKNKKIEEITRYIEEINKRNYKLNIEDNSEDELSILKNEIYKVTVMLKEQAENSKEDKIKLKDSLSDISHQLKTPLTSILIMLDNILDNPDMEKSVREDFIKDIKRKILNINFLVQSLLKLSKLDSNTITFSNNKIKVMDVLVQAIDNVSVLSDLKNVSINVLADKNEYISVDEKWEIEALTNIIKNAVEYSNNGGMVNINIENKKLYTEISIQDFGKGMSNKDLKHIFERFYKGESSSKDSIGIGLALSKAIIEKDNGIVSVDSKIGKGTTFRIKYFNEEKVYEK